MHAGGSWKNAGWLVFLGFSDCTCLLIGQVFSAYVMTDLGDRYLKMVFRAIKLPNCQSPMGEYFPPPFEA